MDGQKGSRTPTGRSKQPGDRTAREKPPREQSPLDRRTPEKSPRDAGEKAAHDFDVAVVGCGLVGSLTALYCAQRGWNVTAFDVRRDPRKDEHRTKRPQAIAMATRAVTALDAAGVGLPALGTAVVPVIGQMVHERDTLQVKRFGPTPEKVLVADSRRLNEQLLTAAEQTGAVTAVFEATLKECALDERRLIFQTRDGATIDQRFDLIIGCDGAYSRIRREVMRRTRMSYAQVYSELAHIELTLPADCGLDSRLVHVWPRGDMLLVAMPLGDSGAFSLTLYLPFAQLDALRTPAAVAALFDREFADVAAAVPADALYGEVSKHAHNSLISVKCTPYHYGGRCVFIGDAAHAMLPADAVGLDAGFEDVRLLFELLDAQRGISSASAAAATPTASPTVRPRDGPPPSPSFRAMTLGDAPRAAPGAQQYAPTAGQLARALEAYSAQRYPDSVAACDFARRRFDELCGSVGVGRGIWGGFAALFGGILPAGASLQAAVLFSNVPYSAVLSRHRALLRRFYWAAQVVSVAAGALVLLRVFKR